jgi:3-hydroxybutyryl-CoA dehydrogenase
MIERKELGVKTGKGFYSYPNPEFTRPDFMKG